MAGTRIDPDCPFDTRSPVVTALRVFAWIYLALSVLAGAVVWGMWTETRAMFAQLGVAGADLPMSGFYLAAAVGVPLQGAVAAAILLGIAHIVESTIGVRINSRAAVQELIELRRLLGRGTMP